MNSDEIAEGIVKAVFILVGIGGAAYWVASFASSNPGWAAALAALGGVVATIIYACNAFARSAPSTQRTWMIVGVIVGLCLIGLGVQIFRIVSKDTGFAAAIFWPGVILTYLSARFLWNSRRSNEAATLTAPVPAPEYVPPATVLQPQTEPRPAKSPLDVAPRR